MIDFLLRLMSHGGARRIVRQWIRIHRPDIVELKVDAFVSDFVAARRDRPALDDLYGSPWLERAVADAVEMI